MEVLTRYLSSGLRSPGHTFHHVIVIPQLSLAVLASCLPYPYLEKQVNTGQTNPVKLTVWSFEELASIEPQLETRTILTHSLKISGWTKAFVFHLSSSCSVINISYFSYYYLFSYY